MTVGMNTDRVGEGISVIKKNYNSIADSANEMARILESKAIETNAGLMYEIAEDAKKLAHQVDNIREEIIPIITTLEEVVADYEKQWNGK